MHTILPTCKKVAVRLGQTSRSLALLAALGLPTLSQAQTIAFPRDVPFTGKDAGGFTLGGNAFLTATGASAANGTVSGTAIDNDGSGVLRLTNATSNPQQAGYAIDNNTFATPNGFSISFEFFAYGTNTTSPADGFSVFLVDGVGTTPGSGFAIGGFGGSLGYAPRNADEPGVTKGYLGIGIDEYGNYGIASENKSGGYYGTGTTLLPNAVSLRGPYTASDATYKTGYAYLAGSGSLPFNLAVGTANTNATTKGSRITDPANAGYRKAYINVIPVTTNGTIIYKITVRIQNGQNVTTAVNNFTVTDPPSTLRVGFGASTGGSNSIHEIRGLKIVQAPIAVDDQAGTKYNQVVTIQVLDNDLNGGGANIAPATVDLNPSTIGRETSYTVAGQGTFTVNNSGVVTFTPIGSFSGTVSIPYTVQNQNNDISNPGTITVNVTGADVETVVSGPTAINPGTMTSYAVTTTNNGVETATNVRPTLTLPAGFTVFGALPTGATISGSTITFAQTTLTARQSTTNSVQVTAATATGNYSFTSNYVYPSGAVVPDAEAGNNSSTLAVTVSGVANIAGICAVPGKDGPVTLAAGTTPNTYYAGTGTATAGNNTLTVTNTPIPTGSTAIAKGDLLLIMQMQGATMTTTNTATYGTVSAATAGKYEYAVAAGAVSANALTLAGKLANTYTANTSGNTFQVIRIPQYSSLTLSGAVTGSAWNGSTGGVLALEVAGQTDFTSGTLTMNGMGFRGGAGLINTATGGDANTYVSADATRYATKGEGIGGTPARVYNGSATAVSVTSSYQNYATGSYARGKAATGGGGGTYTATNVIYGGGGGANGGAGATGEIPPNTTTVGGGIGGDAAPTPTATTLYLGGGGGAGASTGPSGANALSSSGGIGGGIIMLRSGTVTGTATISANGTTASASTLSINPGGGGGAGGSVVVKASSGLSNLTVTANGGAGTSTTGTNSSDGGGGGGGVVFSNSALKVAASVAAGANGTGAGAGIANATTTIGNDCTPAVTTSLRTTIPQVARSTNMQTTYVYTVSNTGSGIVGLTATPSLAAVGGTANLFTYASMSSVVIQNTDGSNTTVAASDYSVTNASSSTPTFTLASGVVVPSGASVVFTFAASIAASAVNGTAYGSNAAGSYLNPQRTAANGTSITPAYASSSADVVTIVVPLPVKLTKFTAVAVGADALLNWETAQEVNNHHFAVERSLDGITFEGIGSVAGKGTTLLTSTYRYTDAGASAHTADVLYYRLRQVDYDGQSSFSPVQAVRFRHTGASITLYPNPTTSSATLDLSQLPADTYTVQVFETTGRLVQRATYQAGKQVLPLEGLPAGTYFVKVQGASLNSVLPLIKQ